MPVHTGIAQYWLDPEDPELDDPEDPELPELSGAVPDDPGVSVVPDEEPGLSGLLGGFVLELPGLLGLLGLLGLVPSGLLGLLGLGALGLVPSRVLPDGLVLPLFISDSFWWRWKILFHQCAWAVCGAPNKPSIAPARMIV